MKGGETSRGTSSRTKKRSAISADSRALGWNMSFFRRRRGLLALLLALTTALTLAACSSSSATAAPTLADPSATGRELVVAWLTALQQKDMASIDAQLAPNFQIQRADGSSSTKAEYLANPASIDTFELGDTLVGLQNANTLTVRWALKVTGETNGVAVPNKEAARLTGFQWNGERWQIITYANFNAPIS